MEEKIVFGDVRLDVAPRSQRRADEPDDETPFRIALIGDFRGRAARGLRYGADRLAGCRPWPVDKEDFHQSLERAAPALRTPAGPLELRDLDDFHPDALYASAPVFVELRRLRKLLRDPDGFRAAARELLSSSALAAKPEAPSPPPAPAAGGDILDAILGGRAGGDLPPARRSEPPLNKEEADWKAVLHGIVAPHLVPKADPRQGEMLAQLDEAVAVQMRLTLHDPAFQALEASWRCVFLLLDRLETGVDLKIDLIDISRQELLDDLAGDSLTDSGLHRLLVDEASGQAGASAYAVVAWLERLGDSPGETAALAAAARIAALAGSALIAGASPRLAGRDSLHRDDEPNRWSYQAEDAALEAAYRELRALPEARWLALVFPRFLLRTPYGDGGASTDLPGFEELGEHPKHEELLWGPGAAAVACLLGEAFTRDGWSMRVGTPGMLDRRPVWHCGRGSDREMLPGAEVWLTDAAIEKLLGRGLTPLVSVKGRDAVAAPRLQSVADPTRALRGPWESA